MLGRIDFRVCVLLEVEAVFHEKKNNIPFCNSLFSLVDLGAKIVCALTTKLRGDGSYSAPSIW